MAASSLVSLLDQDVYTVQQVDRFLGLSGGTARRWIDGYERAGTVYPPVVRPQSTGRPVVTWGEFSEARHLAEFRYAGVAMVHLRPVIMRLREEFPGIAYPLAYARSLLEVEGREVIWRVQTDVKLVPSLRVVVRSDQAMLNQQTWVLSTPAQRFVDAVEFSSDGIVTRIRPFAEVKDVWLDPTRQFGEPTIASTPTAVIAEQYRAGDDLATIADNYSLNEAQVQQAIRYELLRADRATAA